MTTYRATVNPPGWLPPSHLNLGVPSATFDTAQEAWAYLADERKRAEDAFPGWPWEPHGPETGEYSETWVNLALLASPDGHTLYGDPHAIFPISADGTGTVYGDTPGSAEDDDSDLGLAYSVTKAG